MYALSFSVHNIPHHFYDLIFAWSDCYSFDLKYRKHELKYIMKYQLVL